MGLLILFGVLAGIAIVLYVPYRLMVVRRKGPVIPMVRIALAQNNLEAHMWSQRLRAAGVSCRVQGVGPEGVVAGTMYFPQYEVELWVRAKDARTARELLGF